MGREMLKIMEEVKKTVCDCSGEYCNSNCGGECCRLAQAILKAAEMLAPVPTGAVTISKNLPYIQNVDITTGADGTVYINPAEEAVKKTPKPVKKGKGK